MHPPLVWAMWLALAFDVVLIAAIGLAGHDRNVEDLIIDPDQSVSFVIIGAAGFIGSGRQDVAVLISQIRHQGWKIVMPGAKKEIVTVMPAADMAALDTNASIAAAEVKTRFDPCVHLCCPELRGALAMRTVGSGSLEHTAEHIRRGASFAALHFATPLRGSTHRPPGKWRAGCPYALPELLTKAP